MKSDFELSYCKSKLPIPVGCNELGNSNGLAEEEFKEFIENPKFFSIRNECIKSYKSATFQPC